MKKTIEKSLEHQIEVLKQHLLESRKETLLALIENDSLKQQIQILKCN